MGNYFVKLGSLTPSSQTVKGQGRPTPCGRLALSFHPFESKTKVLHPGITDGASTPSSKLIAHITLLVHSFHLQSLSLAWFCTQFQFPHYRPYWLSFPDTYRLTTNSLLFELILHCDVPSLSETKTLFLLLFTNDILLLYASKRPLVPLIQLT